MSLGKAKRFWKTASVVELSNSGRFGVHLDGRPIRTPVSRQPLAVPASPLAAAVAAEWQAQGEQIDPAAMPMTQMVNTWLDKVEPGRDALTEELLRHAEADALCYFADGPQDLVERQRAAWLPVLDWAAATFGARWCTGSGILPVSQPPEVTEALARAIAALDGPAFTAFQVVAPLLGSLVLGLALVGGRVTVEQAHAAALVDELFQAERWGDDWEAMDRRARLRADLDEATRFLALARG